MFKRLFAWLAAKLAGPHPLEAPQEKLEDYATWQPPKERLVFRYFDGRKWVTADPLRLLKKVLAVRGRLLLDIPTALKSGPAELNAHTAAVKTIREVFAVAPLEDGGLSEIEAVALMDRFMEFMGGALPPLPPAAPVPKPDPEPLPPGAVRGEPMADLDEIQVQLQNPPPDAPIPAMPNPENIPQPPPGWAGEV